MPLTDAKLRFAKPTEKPYKLYDSGGLFVLIRPGGGKLWRFRFTFLGKEKLLALGDYPRISLVDARKRRDAALGLIDEGIDPTADRRERKKAEGAAESLTFEIVAREWHVNRLHEWTAKYAVQIIKRLEEDIFPKIGTRPIAMVEPKEMLAALRAVEARGVLETTRRLKQYASAIFRYAIAAGYCTADPAGPLKGALKPPPRPIHHKALKKAEVADFLTRLAAYDGEAETRIAIHLALMTVVRTTELRAARWLEFEHLDDPEKALWRIPAERMKMSEPHLVPLSRQVIAALESLRALTGWSQFLFPSQGRDGVMSNNTMLFALYRMGFRGRTTTHGFRRLFSTEANEHGFNEDWIERQLAHDERDRIRGAYNAAQYLPKRRQMLQWWADYLDELKGTIGGPGIDNRPSPS